MCLLIGAGTPKEPAPRGRAFLFAFHAQNIPSSSASSSLSMPTSAILIVTVTPTTT
jgi:hypothetical protein